MLCYVNENRDTASSCNDNLSRISKHNKWIDIGLVRKGNKTVSNESAYGKWILVLGICGTRKSHLSKRIPFDICINLNLFQLYTHSHWDLRPCLCVCVFFASKSFYIQILSIRAGKAI